MSSDSPELPLTVTHRRYVAYSEAHYAGGLVDGAYSLRLFGEVATEISSVFDGDEGLLAAYQDVQFKAPIHCGDVIEITGQLITAGRRSRQLKFWCTVVARADASGQISGSHALDSPIIATEATGTVVVPVTENQP